MPLFIAGAGAIALYSTLSRAGLPDALWPLSARIAMMAYAAIAVTVGAAATAGVLKLLLTVLGLSLANWRNSAPQSLARFPRLAHSLRKRRLQLMLWVLGVVVAGMALIPLGVFSQALPHGFSLALQFPNGWESSVPHRSVSHSSSAFSA